MNDLTLLQELWAARPGLGATVEQIADWYQAKADVHTELARHSYRAEDRVAELAHAERARAHATALLAPATTVLGGAAA